MAVGLIFFFVYSLRKESFYAGLALSLTLLKPHLLVPFFCAVLVQALRKRDMRLPLGMVLGLVLQQTICSAFYPEGMMNFIRFMPQLAQNSTALLGATPLQVASYFFGIQWFRPIFILCGILAGSVLGLRKDLSPSVLAHRMVPLSLVVAPYSFSHEFVLLIPAYLAALTALYNLYGDRIKYAILVMAFAMVAILINLHFEFITLAIPIGLLIYSLYNKESKSVVAVARA
jgi:hypothetical protein